MEDKPLPKRKSIRLLGYDYSQEGLYFITICCQDKKNIFGKIDGGMVILNRVGKIAEAEWLKTEQIRQNVELGEFVIMPNHIHAIIIINNDESVGANRIRPVDKEQKGVCNTPLRSPSQTVGAIIRGYKSAVTKQIKEKYDVKNISIWQRNYYEHIIRNSISFQNISDYIKSNPENWIQDDYYTEN